MQESVKIFRAVGIEWMYFVCEKGMYIGGSGMECYEPNVCVLPKLLCWSATH